ncbi:MAG TPA: uracil-DNA glycosylase [Flavobacteriaceae bacterium]|nr:uracil-DNA glycosylase [Flavobacteriaceae bacterium]MAY52031.1 uracil-DNA glycosylase [Flavobacteriaceae bacterium]HBR55400.1 uracil-DNA glycosylase [Flavobacteriaceae bacterium]|tara:strand:- start:1123 stop:1788 length:666 start_codon:yes stop_codon:yes gene_type:complete
MEIKIEASWKSILSQEFEKPYFRELIQFVKDAYQNNRCFPPGKQIFAAFDHTPFHEVKVVILGQDPYHGPGQANGLCFSVADGVPKPPSLQNIFREISDDVQTEAPEHGNLERWANQGVLLLNATLTVQAHQAGSHQNKGWEQFTDAVIEALSKERTGLVFLLWGGYAKKKGRKIDESKHLVLSSGHPSPLSANRGYWFGNKHFSKTNEYLVQQNKQPITW